MSDATISISKRILWRYVNKKLKNTIHNFHVFGVITILFDELIKELKANEKIKIFNFGTLSLKKTLPRKYYDITRKEIRISPGYKIMKFVLAPQIRKKICQQLDIDKTFNHD